MVRGTSFAEIDEARLRHPLERPIFVASAAASVGLAAAAVVVVLLGTEWLKNHPLLERHIGMVRLAAVAAVLAVPLAPVLRRTRRMLYLSNSVRLSDEQLPHVHAVLEAHCARLGVAPVPDLYLCRMLDAPARAFSGLDRDYIVLGTVLFEIPGGPTPDVVGFTLGRALGSLRLGHTRWWDEALLLLLTRTPLLRTPIRAVRTLSCDRYGAALAPDGIRGVLLEAAGPDALPGIDVAVYRRQATGSFPGIVGALAPFVRDVPLVSIRIQALHDAGLWRADDPDTSAMHPGAVERSRVA